MIHPQKRQAQFKVASVSTNANSFGLLGHILVAKNGTAFECGKTRQFAHTKGDIVKVECHYPGGFFNWAGAGFEIPHALPNAPRKVVKEVWALPVTA